MAWHATECHDFYMDDVTADPTLDDISREFPRWHCWLGVSHLYYARIPRTSPAVLVRGESPQDLKDEIIRWLGND